MLCNCGNYLLVLTYTQCFQFALKSFEEGNIAYFNDEKGAFDALRSKRGIIQYLGSFGHKETRTVSDPSQRRPQKTAITKHILLEYGEFDLYKIFMHRLPPVIAPEIQVFWTSLIEIADALKGIHNLKTKNGIWSGYVSCLCELLPTRKECIRLSLANNISVGTMISSPETSSLLMGVTS
jgi:hypothetical protein